MKVMPSLFSQRKTQFVASLKTKVNLRALKSFPTEGKVHFPPHFYDRKLRQNYRIKYFEFIGMEFAIKLPIFLKNIERRMKFLEHRSLQKCLSEFTCFNFSESLQKGILTKLKLFINFNFLFCTFQDYIVTKYMIFLFSCLQTFPK